MAVSGNFGGKVPVVDDVLSYNEQKIYATTTPLDENCIEFELQTVRKYCVDLRQTYLALKLKLVRGQVYETYNSKMLKRRSKKRQKRKKKRRRRRLHFFSLLCI